MRNLLRFILRYHVVFLFFFLEILSFIFIFNFNNYQKARFLNSSDRISGVIYENYNNIINYFRLPVVNRELAEENARLRGLLGITARQIRIPDSLLLRYSNQERVYSYIAARVISNTVNRQHNYLTLNKGSKDGIKTDMGVISSLGVAGVITNVSTNYSTALSLLNTRWNISAKIKRNSYFGSLVWDGKDYRKALLNDIPFHVEIAVGDTIVTSGYSTIFPEGVLLGTIDSFEKEGGDNFYTISINLSVDFKALTYVEVIENNKRSEIENIQKLTTNEEVD
jgi:rod shape-determining protein MreC